MCMLLCDLPCALLSLFASLAPSAHPRALPVLSQVVSEVFRVQRVRGSARVTRRSSRVGCSELGLRFFAQGVEQSDVGARMREQHYGRQHYNGIAPTGDS